MPLPKEAYTKDAIDLASDNALEWLEGRTDGYPRSWEQECRDDERRGDYMLYDDPDFAAPPILGYEALEAAGVVRRVGAVMKGKQERIHFQKVGPLTASPPEPS